MPDKPFNKHRALHPILKIPGDEEDEDKKLFGPVKLAPVPLPIVEGLAVESLEMAAAGMLAPEVRHEADVGEGPQGWTSTPPKLSAAKEKKLAEAIKREPRSDAVVALMRGAREKGSWSNQDANNLLSELESASSASSDARKSVGEVRALQKALQTLKEKHPDRPGKAIQGFSLLLGGLPLVVSGGWEKERAFQKEADELTRRYWEVRKSDLAVKEAGEKSKFAVKAALESRVRAAVPVGVNTAIATVLSRNSVLSPNDGDPNLNLFLPKVWAPKILGTDPKLYEGKIINLIDKINSDDPDPKAKSTMLALSTIIKHREAKMKEMIEGWKENGQANIDIHGNYDGPFKKDDNPTAYHWALAGVSRGKLGVSNASYKRFTENREDAMFNLIQLEMLQGSSKEDAENNVANWMANGALASLYTSPGNMKKTAELVSSMGDYQKLTGERYGQHNKAALDITLDKARLKAIRHRLSNDKKLQPDERARLEKDALALSGNIALKETLKLTFSSAEVEREIKEIETLRAAMVLAKKDSRKERGDLVEYYRKAAGADVDEFRELVPPELLTLQEGGLGAFMEKVTLDKSGRIVKYDANQHKDEESWDRISPDMRHYALASFVERFVTAWDEDEKPMEWRDYKASILKLPRAVERPFRGGSKNDIDAVQIQSEFEGQKGGVWAWRPDEIDGTGRVVKTPLKDTSRDNLLRWLSISEGAKIKNNVSAPRKLLSPEIVELKSYGMETKDYQRIDTSAKLVDLIATLDALSIYSSLKNKDKGPMANFRNKLGGPTLAKFLAASLAANGKEEAEVKAIAETLKEFWKASPYIVK